MRLSFSRTKGAYNSCLLNSSKPYKYRLVGQIDDIWSYNLWNIFALTRLDKTRYVTQYALAKTGECPSARKSASCQKYMKDNIHHDISSIWRENLFGYFFFGHYLLPQQLTVFLELRFWKTVGSSEQTVSAHKCPRISSKQMEAISLIRLCGLSRE